MQEDRKIVRTVLIKDESIKKKNLETKKEKRKVNPKADAKKRQIRSNI